LTKTAGTRVVKRAGRDFRAVSPSAAGQAGGAGQDAVARGLGLGEVAIEGGQPQPGQQGGSGPAGPVDYLPLYRLSAFLAYNWD